MDGVGRASRRQNHTALSSLAFPELNADGSMVGYSLAEELKADIACPCCDEDAVVAWSFVVQHVKEEPVLRAKFVPPPARFAERRQAPAVWRGVSVVPADRPCGHTVHFSAGLAAELVANLHHVAPLVHWVRHPVGALKHGCRWCGHGNARFPVCAVVGGCRERCREQGLNGLNGWSG